MEYNHSQYVIEAIKQNVIPQVRMFFEVEDRKNSFVMSRRKKHLQMQTYTRYGTGSVVMFDYAESPFETFQLEIPYRQAHKARSCACSLCLTEWRRVLVNMYIESIFLLLEYVILSCKLMLICKNVCYNWLVVSDLWVICAVVYTLQYTESNLQKWQVGKK